MMVEEATAEDLVTYIGISGWIGWSNGSIVALGGFMRRGERLFAYIDVVGKAPALALLRAMRRKLEAAGEDIYAVCDVETHKSAPRLLHLLGFIATNEETAGKRIWKWQTR